MGHRGPTLEGSALDQSSSRRGEWGIGRLLDQEDLRAFAEVARSGTFTAAARVLYTTQPSLSRRVARLEDAMGAPLFERDGGAPTLTPLGRTLLPYALDLIAHWDGFVQVAREHVHGARQELVVAIREPLAGTCLPHLARYVEQRAPELHLRVFEVAPDQFGAVSNALLEYRAELGLVTRELVEAASFPSIDSVPFAIVQHYAIGLPRYLGHGRDPIEWEEVASLPLLLAVPASRVTYPLPKAAPIVRHESGNSGLLLAMAKAGMGITVLAGEIGDESMTYRPIEVCGKPQRSEVHLLWRRHGELGAGAKQVVADVRTRVANASLPLLGGDGAASRRAVPSPLEPNQLARP